MPLRKRMRRNKPVQTVIWFLVLSIYPQYSWNFCSHTYPVLLNMAITCDVYESGMLGRGDIAPLFYPYCRRSHDYAGGDLLANPRMLFTQGPIVCSIWRRSATTLS